MIKRFYNKKNIVYLFEITDLLKIKKKLKNKTIVNDIKDLTNAKKKDITFFNSLKYKNLLKKTKASFCLTSSNYEKYVPKTCQTIVVKNVLLSLSKITNLFYPNNLNDNFDKDVQCIAKIARYKKVSYGKNVLIGRNVKIGKNCQIGHNTIIESNVIIGNNCSIGCNVLIRKSIIGNNVYILDECIIGKKGFGFFPNELKNYKYPHIGIVIIEDNVEIGCKNVIDRGSISNTIIGKNTFIDNQVHVAHNVNIGKNCIIAGQVGFAGSTKIGNNVMIGGQAGISGHLNIGNNVKIGGGSGVINDLSDNSIVMGYPAKDIRIFLKENKK